MLEDGEKERGINVGKGREKGKVMYNKIRNQNKLNGQCQVDILKNTTCNQVLDSGIYYSTVEHFIKQLFQELKGGFLSSQLLNIILRNS